jgi:hypothetical protein
MAVNACFGFTLFVTLLLPAAANAKEGATSSTAGQFPRVRSGSAKLAALIDEATLRSATFKSLIASVEATDGIVFVEEGKCPLGVPACLRWQITLTGGYRILFVTIQPRRADAELMASIGHELRHALEVFENPAVRSHAAMHFFYQNGPTKGTPRAIETAAAVAAEQAVLTEVRQSRHGK